MTDVTLYGFPQSTYVRTARLACEEKGVAYALEPVEMGSPAHLEIHPFARIPAMRHDDFLLYETGAIVRYVDRTFDGPPLQPDRPRAIARMNQWISSIEDYYYQVMIRELVFPRIVIPSRGGPSDEEMIKVAVPKVEHQLSVLEKTLAADGFLAGAEVSLADLFLLPILFWLARTPEGEEALNGYPAVNRWNETVAARPGAIATVPPMPGK
jgi:glutathione S-transferase